MLFLIVIIVTFVGCSTNSTQSSSESFSSTVSATVTPEKKIEDGVSISPDSEPETQSNSETPTASSESEPAPTDEPTVSNTQENHILIAYYSWSGNTKQLAEEIQSQTGGDIFAITPEVPYTADINELSGISLQEQRENVRPALSSHVEDISKYNIVFIGYPNWWNDAPMPVFTFLEEYDFTDKIVIPFSTYGNGRFGRSIQSIENTVSGANLLDGIAVQEHELDSAAEQVSDWLQKLQLP